MSLWHPITYNALAKLIASEEKAMEKQLLDFWLKIKIRPEKWQESMHGAEFGGFWAVGICGRRVIWYNDIEEGFDISEFRKFKVIDSYSADQYELSMAVRQLKEDVAALEVKSTYIRFVVGVESEEARFQSGLFTECAYLRKEGLLEPYQELFLKETFDHFNEYLPCPPYRGKNWSVHAVAWFKDTSIAFIRRMWDLVAILEQHDVHVRILRTKKPGMILYEDDHQVVAQSRKY